MNAPFSTRLRRGACPSLSTPMQTGDGLLVRLLPAEGGLTPAQLGGVAKAAAKFGNGILEVTQRGSLQIRGLTPATVGPLNGAVAALGIAVRTGLPVDMAPLAGLDPAELADPRPLAIAIRDGAEALLARLGPKVSVVVDGGKTDWLAAVKADVRLTAVRQDGGVAWRMALAGDAISAVPVGLHDEDTAAEAALTVLYAIADLGKDARARDLPGDLGRLSSTLPPSVLPDISHARGEITRSVGRSSSAAFAEEVARPTLPISPLAGEMSGRTEGGAKEQDDPDLDSPSRLLDSRHALAIALPFGFTTARDLSSFTRSAATLGIGEIRLAPRNSLILLCPSAFVATSARALADSAGFITTPSDPRRAIVACAGAPACASGHYDTRALAARVAAANPAWLNGSFRLHLSGCAKGCAEPAGPSIALVGGETGPTLVANGTSPPPGLREDLAGIP